MEYAQLTDHLRKFTPLADEAEAQLALASTLEMLGFLLPKHLTSELQRALPAACRSLLEPHRASNDRPHQETVLETGASASGRALERVQEVCGVLRQLLPADLVRDLARELPPPLAGVFDGTAAHPVGHLDPHPRAAHGAGRHISDASTGSDHPLASARPRAAQPNSVAAANPHQETKLSSAHGMSQEREGRTLADAAPPQRRRDS